jgi:signal transduction histidine kinase
MGPAARAEPGGTLERTRGIPYAAVRARLAGTRPVAAGSAALLAFVLGVAAVAGSAVGIADAGTAADPGEFVSYVAPSGYAWDDGIRPGQRVLEAATSDTAGGWYLLTEDPVTKRRFESSAWLHEGALRRSLPIAVGALVMAAIALLLALTRHRSSAVFAVLAVILATAPLGRLGEPLSSTVALAATVVLPFGWVAGRQGMRWPAQVLLLVTISAFVGYWVLARTLALPEYDNLDQLRSLVAFASLGVMLVALVAIPLLQREFPSLSPLRVVDLATLAILAAVSITIVAVFRLPPLLVAVVLVVAVAVYPSFRRTAAVAVDRLLLSDLRERAAIEATEEERARLARDLHDAPLQQLAGVIRRLEMNPEVAAESDELRGVAGQLRAVATNLRPPVLDDLGLAAALSFLADRTSTPDIEVVTDLADETGISVEERAPAGVELAMYRIAEEAVNNARLHGQATRVVIGGRIAPDRVHMSVRDNGRGLSRTEMDAAARRGRLGLASMRRRAELIGATLELSSHEGAIVEATWPR